MKLTLHKGFLPLALFVATAIAAPAQQEFDTPAAAFKAVADACAAQDTDKLASILGPKSKPLMDDETKAGLGEFAAAYEEDHEVLEDEGKHYVQVGSLGFTLPFPLVAAGDKWTFDLDGAMDEILTRRIGRNELTAIETLRAFVDAQRAYASEDYDGDEVFEYAQRVRSSDGKRDGLYFKTEDNEALSPFGPLVAEKAAYLKGKEAGDPYFGYYYKILFKQGEGVPGGAYDFVINGNMIAGYAMVAWPAEYGKSGIMSFSVNHQGKVYDKDLGEKTAATAAGIDKYQPDDTWSVVPQDGVDETTASSE